MNPFIVLNMDQDTTVAQVEDRYNELVLRYPPEQCPERFALIRAAYERLNSPLKIQRELLFGYDSTARALTEFLDSVPPYIERHRLDTRELGAVIQACRLKMGPVRIEDVPHDPTELAGGVEGEKG